MNEATIDLSYNLSIKINSTLHHQTLSTDQLATQPTRQATFIGAILAFVFIFFGLIGNILVITTILSVKKLRVNIINIFIVSVRFKTEFFFPF
jgi:hypothetical protein